MNVRPFVLGLLAVATLSACNTSSQPTFEMPDKPLDQYTAESMLMRSLQAEESGDYSAEEADLFPRQHNILAACAKLRVNNGKIASIGMRDENGTVPKITGVTVSGLQVAEKPNIFRGSYSAVGNNAYSGSEQFIWANGRWWIRCNM